MKLFPGRPPVLSALRSILAIWLAVACLAVADGAGLADSRTYRLTIILCSDLTADALDDPACPSLAWLAQSGAVGLVAIPVRAGRTEPSAVLSIASGRTTSASSTDADIYLRDERIERSTAWQVLLRRTNFPAPPDRACVVHLGIASLQRRGLADSFLGEALRSSLGARLVAAPLHPGASVYERLAGLLAVTADGTAPCHGPGQRVTVYHVGQSREALERRIRDALSRGTDIWIIGTRASKDANSYLMRPVLTVLAGPGVLPGTFRSATTRWDGLVALEDIKPTVMSWMGARDPLRPALTVTTIGDPICVVRGLDAVAETNLHALIPVLLGYGALAAGALLLALVSLHRPKLRLSAAGGLHLIMGLPMAFLVCGPLPDLLGCSLPPWVYALAVLVVSAAFAALLTKARGPVDVHSVIARFLFVTILMVVVDAVSGQRCLRTSLLATCGMGGIRFYGVGNEYMGILIGAALGLVFLQNLRPPLVLATGLALAMFFGLGRLGANAGGIVTAVTALGVATLVAGQQRVRMLPAVVLMISGVVLAWLFAFLDTWLYGANASHLGRAILYASVEGSAFLGEIALRKALMNLGIILSWPAILAVSLAITAVAWIARFRRTFVTDLAQRHPEWGRWALCSLMGAAAAFLFNDTGFVAAMFLLGPCIVGGLLLAVAESPDRAGRLVE